MFDNSNLHGHFFTYLKTKQETTHIFPSTRNAGFCAGRTAFAEHSCYNTKKKVCIMNSLNSLPTAILKWHAEDCVLRILDAFFWLCSKIHRIEATGNDKRAGGRCATHSRFHPVQSQRDMLWTLYQMYLKRYIVLTVKGQ